MALPSALCNVKPTGLSCALSGLDAGSRKLCLNDIRSAVCRTAHGGTRPPFYFNGLRSPDGLRGLHHDRGCMDEYMRASDYKALGQKANDSMALWAIVM